MSYLITCIGYGLSEFWLLADAFQVLADCIPQHEYFKHMLSCLDAMESLYEMKLLCDENICTIKIKCLVIEYCDQQSVV